MEQNLSWGAKRFSDSQEIPRILWTEKFITTFIKAPPVPILTHINPVYAPSYFLKIHFSSTLQSTLPSSKWSPFFRSLHQNHVRTSCLPYVLHDPPISFLKDQQNIWRKVHVMNLLVMWSSPVPSYLVPRTPKYLLLHPFLEHPQPMFLPRYVRPILTLT
jgi:hypothetical protein